MRAVLLIALVAVVAVSSVSAGYVWKQPYNTTQATATNFLCGMDTLPTVSFNITGGTCFNATSTSTGYYCVGTNVLQVSFSDLGCVTANAVTQYPTNTCGQGSTSQTWMCTGSDSVPGGLTFPPSGWSQSTATYNNTFNPSNLSGGSPAGSGESTGSCDPAPPKKVQVLSAAAPPTCQKRVTGVNDTPYSTKSYCKSNSGFQAVYLSADCTGTLYKLTQQPAAKCTNGVTSTCTDVTVPAVPANLPGTVASATTYSGPFCNVPSAFYSQVWFSPDCVDSSTIQCVSNATAIAGTVSAGSNIRLTQYVPAAGGACSGALATSTAQNPNPQYKNTTGQCDNAQTGYVQSYSCSTTGNGGGNGGNSASSASVSVVALVVAAFIALISQ